MTLVVLVFLFKDHLNTREQAKFQASSEEQERPKPLTQEEIKETLAKTVEEDKTPKEAPPKNEINDALTQKAEQPPADPVSSSEIQNTLNAKAN